MQIEGAFIRSVRVKNLCQTLKEFYLVVSVNQNKWVGNVQMTQFGDTNTFSQFQTQNISLESTCRASISLWDYDAVNEIKRVYLPTNQIQTQYSFKLFNPNIQLQICCQSKSTNFQRICHLQESQKGPRNSLPYLKKSLSKRNSFKPKHQISNESSAVLYPTVQNSQNSLVYIEEDSLHDTSLEKLINYENKSSKSNQKVQGSKKEIFQERTKVGKVLQKITLSVSSSVPDTLSLKKSSKNSAEFINSFEYKNFIRATNSTNFFDDYEARPKQNSKKQLAQSEKVMLISSQQKHLKTFNSTSISSAVKKNLKNVISVLTKHPLKADSSQRNRQNIQTQGNSSRQFFDYGLTQSKKIQQNQKLKSENKNNRHLNKQENLQLFYEKHLTRKQIQKVARMTSFELSRSIFQQYGLDLSLTKMHASKSFEKSKHYQEEGLRVNKQRKRRIQQKSKKEVKNQEKKKKTIKKTLEINLKTMEKVS